MRKLTALSLFASSGIGDLALRACGVEVLVANELLEDRAELFRRNFPNTLMISGDIKESITDIVNQVDRRVPNGSLDVLFATPPCQGMSKNGRGKLLNGAREGLRKSIDPRNQLATYVPKIAHILNPKIIIFENVPEMENIIIEAENGGLIGLLEMLEQSLSNYSGVWKTIEFADFGVPQRRQRLITLFIRQDVMEARGISTNRDEMLSLFPDPTHSSGGSLMTKPWVSVLEAIGSFPLLDAADRVTAQDAELPYHRVPTLDERKYWWVSSTPEASSAFDNQCVNPVCQFTGNPTHGSDNSSGINRASEETPIYCAACGNLLPRPSVVEDGQIRLMKGFTSAYKRMRPDLPASALTRNFSYACSDQKVHPTQNRVLSLREAMALHTITDYEYHWELSSGKKVSDKLIRDSIGESIPPKGLEIIFRSIFEKTIFNNLP